MILVSACLAGSACRYDGRDNLVESIRDLVLAGKAVAVCPEVAGGLSTPRPPAEIRNDRVMNCNGQDVTDAYARGAEEALRICREHGCKLAVLKASSPSCGCGAIHNGFFDGGLVPGNGITAQLLMDHGVEVITEKDWEKDHV